MAVEYRYDRWLTWGALGLILLGCLWGIWRGTEYIGRYADHPPDFDEAVHLLPTLQLANDVRRYDVGGFWQHTLNQEQLAAYPFVHAWLSSPAFLAWPDITTVRVMSLVYLAGAILLAFAAGYEVAGHKGFGWLAGLTSAGLTLISLPLWVYGSLAYLESAGLLVIMLALWLYLRAWPGGRRERFFAIAGSLAVTAAFFTKYNFGLFLAGGMALNEVVHVLLARRFDWQRWLYLGGPALLLIGLWFTNLGRWQRFFLFSRAQQGDLGFWQWESWRYYLSSFAQHYTAGALTLMLIVAGLLYAFHHWREYGYRALLSYLVVSFVILLIVPQKAPRFLYTVAPVSYLLAGALAGAGVAWLAQRPRPIHLLFMGLFIAALLWEATNVYRRFRLYDYALEIAYDSAPATATAYQFAYSHSLDHDLRLHMLNGWHLFSAPALQWTYLAAQGYLAAPVDYWRVTNSLAPEPVEANLDELVARLRRDGVQMVLSIDGSPAGPYSGWDVVEPLLARGILEPVASSPAYTVRNWADSYREQVLAGAFTSAADLETARTLHRSEFTIRLHLYRVR